MSYVGKENKRPRSLSFAKKAAKTAVSRSITPTPNQLDKVVESVANATKRLSQNSSKSTSSRRKVENRIGPWRLGRTLGKGSTGRVRLAKNSLTGQLAAIKIVPKFNNNNNNNNTNASDNNNTNANNNNNKSNNNTNNKKKNHRIDSNGLPYGIEREIIIMKLISHPNIMALYDVWENENELYLVLEYVEGGELFDFLINNGKLNEKDAVNYFRMIINGVSYCHKFNICHRDLKPENILLDKNGKIKIADFGMAALETKQKLLETSCGSPHYASPEIVSGKNYHGSPSDVWSCGIILFALLTGHLPFDDPNIRTLLLKVQTGKFHMPSGLSPEAKDLIWSMLRVDPNERISIKEILNHPLLLKYPLDGTPDFENQLDNLDVSKPIETIDQDILHNLQTLWHGANLDRIILKLKNNEKNSEKMFYYLLENYKLTHSIDLNNKFKRQQPENDIKLKIPRSTSIVKTTIEDENGNILKSEIQKLTPTRKPLRKRSSNNLNINNINNNSNNHNNKIIASSSFKKSVSFRRLQKDQSSSTLSIVNMKQRLSIKPQEEMLNTSKSITVNPKDLPDLPDLNDYNYLVNTIFDPKINNKIDDGKTNDIDIFADFNFSSEKSNNNNKNKDFFNDLVLLDISDTTDDTFKDDINFTKLSLDPNVIKKTKSNMSEKIIDIKNNNSKTTVDNNNSANAVLNQMGVRMSRLEMLKANKPVLAVTQMKSIKSSSTRNLHSFLDDEYKTTKLEEYNSANRNKNSLTKLTSSEFGHKVEKSTDSSYFDYSDVSYSLHSAIQVPVLAPTDEDLIKLKADEEKFADADESNNSKTFILDSSINSKLKIHKKANSISDFNENQDSSNTRNGFQTDVRYSILTNSNYDLPDSNDKKFNLTPIKKQILEEGENEEEGDGKGQKTNNADIRQSLFDDAEEFKAPSLPIREDTNIFDDSSEQDVTLHTAQESLKSPVSKAAIFPNQQPTINPVFSSSTRSTHSPALRISMLSAATEATTATNVSSTRKLPSLTSSFKNPKLVPSRPVQMSPMDPTFKRQLLPSIQAPQARRPVPPPPNIEPKIDQSVVPSVAIQSNVTKPQVTRNIADNNHATYMEQTTKRPNWLKRFFSSFSKNSNKKYNAPSTTPDIKIKTNTRSRLSKLNNFNNFNNGQSTTKRSSIRGGRKGLFKNYEYWIESDLVTKADLIKSIKSDSRTASLRFVSMNKSETVLICEIGTLTFRLEITEKVGGEFGFGGCFIKFVKVKGSRNLFDQYCVIIRNIVEELEKSCND